MDALADGAGHCTRNDVRLWYRVEGSRNQGLPLLLLHGGPGATARPFERTIGPLLAAFRPVVYMDCRGAGRSDRPSQRERYSLDEFARDAEALRCELGIERWSLLGHSLGAATVLTYAATFPDRVAALCLCAPMLHGPLSLQASLVSKVVHAPPAQRMEAQRIYQSNCGQEEKFTALLALIDQPTRYGWQFFEPENHLVLEAIQAELAAELGQELMSDALWHGLVESGLWRFDGFDLLARVTMPQAILISPTDTEVSVEAALRYAVAANAEVILYRRSGHHPYLEESATCARQTQEFLRGHGL